MTDLSIAQELSRGEHLVWSGKPRQGIVLRGADALMIPFSFLWGGFAVFWEVSVLASGGPTFFALFGVPFVLMGLYITVGRFFYDAWRRGRTLYGVTSERIIIATGGISPSFKSLNVRTLTDVTLDAKSSGSGTITFGPTGFATSMYAGTAWPGIKLPPSFELIPDARRVYELIREGQKGSPAGSAA
jgi:hypothetical protein